MTDTTKNNKVKIILDIIDTSIKRLLSPATMLVAAVLMSKGLGKPESNEIAIKTIIVLLSLFSIGHFIGSLVVAVKEFDEAGINKVAGFFLSTGYMLIYFVLFVVAVVTGVGKVIT